MYGAIVVDDDKIIRRNIVKTADWEKAGFECKAEAFDGQDALEKIETFRPDLVITDICMPEIDGLELMSRVKLRYPTTKFIVLSNYDDFKYVKNAMKLGAIDYILKYEINRENLSEQLKSAGDLIDSEKKSKQQQNYLEEFKNEIDTKRQLKFWNKLFREDEDIRDFLQEANSIGIRFEPLNGVFFVISAGENFSAEQMRQTLNSTVSAFLKDYPAADIHCFTPCRNQQFIYLNFKNDQNFSSIMMNLIGRSNELLRGNHSLSSHYLFAIGDFFHNIDQMHQSALKTTILAKSIYYDSDKCVITSNTFRPFQTQIDTLFFDSMIDRIIQNLITKKIQQAHDETEALIQNLVEKRIDPTVNHVVFHNLIYRLNSVVMEEGGECREIFKDYINRIIPMSIFDDITEIEVIKKKIHSLLNSIDQKLYDIGIETKNDNILKALNFIILNQQKQIGLKEVADYVGLSKNHFCRLFKAETNENFLSFLNRIRIERAKQFLLNTNMSITKIAEATGFSDYRYFERVFIKYQKAFPSDCRKDKGLLKG